MYAQGEFGYTRTDPHIWVDYRVVIARQQHRDSRIYGLVQGLKKLSPVVLAVGTIKAPDLKVKIVPSQLSDNQPTQVVPPLLNHLEIGFKKNGNTGGANRAWRRNTFIFSIINVYVIREEPPSKFLLGSRVSLL